MHLKVTTPPTVEVLTLAEAKKHLRLEIDDDDDYVAELLVACREACERWYSRSYLETGWRLTLGAFPGVYAPGLGYFAGGVAGAYAPRECLERGPYGTVAPILIPVAELIAVSAVSYIDQGGALQVMDPSAYQVVAGAPGLITPAYGTSWPSTRWQPEAVRVDFTAGYGSTADDVPRRVRAAVKLLLGHLYENRESTTTLSLSETPLAFRTILALTDWGYRA